MIRQIKEIYKRVLCRKAKISNNGTILYIHYIGGKYGVDAVTDVWSEAICLYPDLHILCINGKSIWSRV